MSLPYLLGEYRSVYTREAEYRFWTIQNHISKIKERIKNKKEEIEILKRILKEDLNPVQIEYWNIELIETQQLLKRLEKQASILLA